MKDLLPQPKESYFISSQWQSFIRNREKSLAQDKLHSKTYYDSHQVKNHDPLTVGQQVACQNTRSRRWDRTGLIIEVCDFRQYKVKINGSGRISLRNRVHLKPLLHIKPYLQVVPGSRNKQNNVTSSKRESDKGSTTEATNNSQSNGENSMKGNSQPNKGSIIRPHTVEHEQVNIPRRSERQKNKPQRYGEWCSEW